MKFLSGIFGQKDKGAAVDEKPARFPVEQAEKQINDAANLDSVDVFDLATSADSNVDSANASTIENVVDTIGKPRDGAVNIWDLDGKDDPANPAASAAPAVAAPDRASSRARRNRTRLIGFDKSDGDVVDLFDEEKKITPSEKVVFPVGWMLVVEGPGRGHCFAVTAGMAQIGRAEDQAIQLDFGDAAISRNNHAAIVYDPDEKKFLLGHGGKANIVRLNGKPVISNEDLVDGDKISIGETVLLLKTLVGENFTWDEADTGEDLDDDMAIA